LIVGMGALALFPCYYSYVQELSTSHVGRLTGVLSAWVWLVSSPIHWVFGAIKDKTGSYDTGLMICGLAPWIGVIAMKLLWTKDPTVPSTASSPSHAH
jgi:ACS family hexuronate transporter-like MFS transporter